MVRKYLKPGFLSCTALFSVFIFIGCAAESAKIVPETAAAERREAESRVSAGPTIKIEPNSPADTVRVFYKNLYEKKFREAIYLTNLRPAVEGLTDAELKEFQADLESIAANVPAQLQINGEIVSGDSATVTAKVPDDESGKTIVQEIRLRLENGVWVILTVDEAAEQIVRKEGKNYFYQLRIDTHQDEARTMLERISKAELAFAVQNGGLFTDIRSLVAAQLLPDDIETAQTTGYKFAVDLAGDKKMYTATATPAEYGKSGRLSFVFESDGRRIPKIVSKDNGGQPLKK